MISLTDEPVYVSAQDNTESKSTKRKNKLRSTLGVLLVSVPIVLILSVFLLSNNYFDPTNRLLRENYFNYFQS